MKILKRLHTFFFLLCLTKFCFGSRLAPQGRVHGGTIPEDGFLPYMATIQTISGKNVCGGVIIASQWILTAAQCLFSSIENMRIGTGGVYWTNHDTLHSVEQIVPHADFNEQLVANDIGLIKLDRPIAFDECTLPIKLAKKNSLKRGDILMIAGRGVAKKPNLLSELLKIAEVKYLEPAICRKLAVNASQIREEHICTDTRSGIIAPKGDAGGPLIYKNDILVGIISAGPIRNYGRPLIHMSVAYYYDWIVNTVNEINSTS